MRKKILWLMRFASVPLKLLAILALSFVIVFVAILDGVNMADLMIKGVLTKKVAGMIFYAQCLLVAWFIFANHKPFYGEAR